VTNDELIGAHGVANVSDIAARLEVADMQHRLATTGFDLGNLARKARGDIGR
jgi:hypothetical protein